MGTPLPLALTIGLVTFLLGVIWGSPFIEALRRLRVGKQVRKELQDTHGQKIGTPTMGGFMILIPATLIMMALNIAGIVQQGQGASIFLPLGVMLGFGFLGFIDDWEGIRNSRGLIGEGISARAKLIGQIILSGGAAVLLSQYQGGFAFANEMQVPLLSFTITLSPIIFILITMFIIIGTSNAMNFTDGLDGLAGLITACAFAAYGVIAFLQGQVYLVQLCFILVGASFAFLWYNAHPAQLFMGDIGALSLGATLGVVAVMTGEWLLLPIIAIVPVIEMISVILQVLSARYSRRYLGADIRLFKRAPLHHHFELSGWSETQVVQRFWLIGLLSAMIGVALALL